MPPKNCLTRSFAFSRAKMEPQIRNLETILSGWKSIEKRITSTKAIKTWTNNKERKHFIQALKNEAVALLQSDKKAKGAINTNTFTKIKRIA